MSENYQEQIATIGGQIITIPVICPPESDAFLLIGEQSNYDHTLLVGKSVEAIKAVAGSRISVPDPDFCDRLWVDGGGVKRGYDSLRIVGYRMVG